VVSPPFRTGRRPVPTDRRCAPMTGSRPPEALRFNYGVVCLNHAHHQFQPGRPVVGLRRLKALPLGPKQKPVPPPAPSSSWESASEAV
jgi:hypothetical protein